ncbi:hypothetical protein [Nocardioides marmoriginsengisoli]|nr:hypothetical protein [Nocardioides marmoriginsengisoli]
MKTRHVWMLPPLDVGLPRQGLVLTWRRRVVNASPPMWEAYVLWIDERREEARVEWVPASYLQPVESEAPLAGRQRGHQGGPGTG